MNQNNVMNSIRENDEMEIDLLELFYVLWSKIHIILLSGILMALLVFVGTKLFITPMYTSVTKLYVLSRQDSSSGVTYTELQTGSQLTKDYVELITSRPILEQVIAILDLDMEAHELKDRVTVATPSDTRILSISVESENPKEAKEIVDVLRDTAGSEITKIMRVESVEVIEDGNLPKEPSSPNLMKNTVLGGMLGLFIAIAVFAVLFILDDTIKTPDDVERFMELSVLTSIPIEEKEKKSEKVKRQKKNRRGMKR